MSGTTQRLISLASAVFILVCQSHAVVAQFIPAKSAQDRKLPPLSFTEEQAIAGKLLYAKNCASCHGSKLEGIHLAPGLSGRRFDGTWRGRSAQILGIHVRRMPPKVAPGTISEEDYTNILAYLLEANDIEPGDESLPTKIEQLADFAVPLRPGQEAYDPFVPVEPTAEQIALLKNLPPVTAETLLHPSPSDWLHWGRTYSGHSHSPLDQINKDNIGQLKAVWRAPLIFGNSMPMPVVYQGVMFFQTCPDTTLAMDATTGEVLWRYQREVPKTTKKMGLALHGNRVYVPTSDFHVVALEMKTGEPVWEHEIDIRPIGDKSVEDVRQRMQIRSAPLIVNNLVIQAMLGSFAAGGAFIVAIDMDSGEEVWRFHTVARPGQPGGDSWNDVPVADRSGGSVWQQGTYDPETNLIYYGVAPTYDTKPLLVPLDKPGVTNDALYTNCTIALDADTGELEWYFQHTQNDQWDLDWAFERIIAEIPYKGSMRKAVMNVGKTAVLDALDAETGEFLFTADTGLQNVIIATDPVTGKKTINPEVMPNPDQPCIVCPLPFGARSWPQTSFSPRTNYVYVPITESCVRLSPTSEKRTVWTTGVQMKIADEQPALKDGMMGRVQAIDCASGELAWNTDHRAPASTGLLSTAGGLLFSGDIEPSLKAFDDATGEIIWQAELDDFPSSSVITYEVSGRQYIAVVCGLQHNWIRDISMFYRRLLDPETMVPGDVSSSIWVFALDNSREWTVGDLEDSLTSVGAERSPDNGRKLFASTSCLKCHKESSDTSGFAPTLSDIRTQLTSGKLDRRVLLESILEPSAKIEDRYRTRSVVTANGELVSGVVVYEDDNVIRLLANPLDDGARPVEVAKDEIEEQVVSEVSVMPAGLLNTLSEDEILDLLAYIEDGE